MKKISLIGILATLFLFSINILGEEYFNIVRNENIVKIENVNIDESFIVAKLNFSNLKLKDNSTGGITIYDDMVVVYGDLSEKLSSLEFEVIDEEIDGELKLSLYDKDIRISKIGDKVHYYEFVSGNYSFNEALFKSKESILDNLKGYLATILSDSEKDIIASFNTVGFAGASCGYEVDEGYLYDEEACDAGLFRWISGPDKDVSLEYHFFHPTEPNNTNKNETYLLVNYYDDNSWNDIGDYTGGYYLEYSEYGDEVMVEDNSYTVVIEKKVKPQPTVESKPDVVQNENKPVTDNKPEEVVSDSANEVTESFDNKPIVNNEKKIVKKVEKPVSQIQTENTTLNEVEEKSEVKVTFVGDTSVSNESEKTDEVSATVVNSNSIINRLNVLVVGFWGLVTFMVFQVIRYLWIVKK